uniref:Transposon protein, putative, CACTA, En/Spm sub-class n=2 Tax=Oryza sativa subsp. japonica TaxID=39947 RepID=Q8LNA8_ORYSJ|nr:Hypothetical protein [Oryza sativa Japonica Group]AAP52436.1 hypothetical protein LOC_Os10g10020 [Oryza sativa Japonica Group]
MTQPREAGGGSGIGGGCGAPMWMTPVAGSDGLGRVVDDDGPAEVEANPVGDGEAVSATASKRRRRVGGREIWRGAAAVEESVAGRSGGGQRENRKRWWGDPPCSPLAARHAPAMPITCRAHRRLLSATSEREREKRGERRERGRGGRGVRQCFKQPSSTNLCGYYMLEMLRVNRRYTTNINHTPEISYVANRFDNTTIMKVCADICHFIRCDCCNALGQSYDNESQLALEDKFKPLREWGKNICSKNLLFRLC